MGSPVISKVYVVVQLQTLDGWTSLGPSFLEFTSSSMKIVADSPPYDVGLYFEYSSIRLEVEEKHGSTQLLVFLNSGGNDEHMVLVTGDPLQVDELAAAILQLE